MFLIMIKICVYMFLRLTTIWRKINVKMFPNDKMMFFCRRPCRKLHHRIQGRRNCKRDAKTPTTNCRQDIPCSLRLPSPNTCNNVTFVCIYTYIYMFIKITYMYLYTILIKNVAYRFISKEILYSCCFDIKQDINHVRRLRDS